jgi:glycosyltransferase involved in cell wall biosynthesis
MRLSIVIPAYNERDSIGAVFEEISQVVSALGRDFEIIFVDDGSTDGTEALLATLTESDDRVHAIRLQRNQGKSAAYMAGFAEATGNIVVTLDADLQDDPISIPTLLNALNDHSDVVIGWKEGRFQNEARKAVPSFVFNAIVSAMFGLRLHDSNCGMRAMRAEVAKSLDLRGDYYRFIPQLASHMGFRVVEERVQHRRRKFGTTKYGWSRFLTGLLDAIALRFTMSFQEKPLHAFGALALPFLGTGFLLEAYVLYQKALGDAFLDHVAAISVGALFLTFGMQILCVGLVGVLLAASHRPPRLPAGLVSRLGSPDAYRLDQK